MPSIAECYKLSADHRRFQTSSQLVLPNCYVGVEVELERTGGRRLDGLWQTKTDGSLQDDGLEYAFAAPMFGQDIIDALQILEETFDDEHPGVGSNTSLHVHVDVRDLDTQQLCRMVLLYIIYEQVLFNYCAPEREDNVFCLSVERSKVLLNSYSVIYDALLSGRPDRVPGYTGSMPRYMGMNVQSINKFGTLEFRGHRGEWRSDAILRWINILLSLKKAAIDSSIPHDKPYVAIKSRGVTAFTMEVFGPYFNSLNNNDLHEQIHTGMQLARSIVNLRPDSVYVDLDAMGAIAGTATCDAIATAHGKSLASTVVGYNLLYDYLVEGLENVDVERIMSEVHTNAPDVLELLHNILPEDPVLHTSTERSMLHNLALSAYEGDYRAMRRAVHEFMEPPDFDSIEPYDDYDPADELEMTFTNEDD